MFTLPNLILRLTQSTSLQKDLLEAQEAFRESNKELQLCVSELFEQKRHYESQLAHLVELLQGSECEIGGVEVTWKRGIDDPN